MNATIDELILLAGGVFLTVLGIGKMRGRRKLLKNGIRVEGRVIENHFSVSGQIYYPVIRYVTLEKDWVTKKYDIGSSPPAFKEGETVKVIYSPDNHEQFMLDNWHSKLFAPALIIVGIALIASVIAYYVMHQY
jgi:hypothetical protein